MAAVDLPVNITDRSANGSLLDVIGVTPDAAGDQFVNTGKELLIVDNSLAAAPCVVDFVTPNTVDGEAIGDKQVTVATGKIAIYGPFGKSTYTNSGTKKMDLSTDVQTNVKLSVIKVGV